MQMKPTPIVGLFEIALEQFPDNRGSFTELWQTEKLQAQGLPDLRFRQASVSKSVLGATRGIHAEPWGKYITVPYGRVFSAIVDLRKESPTFGLHATFELDETKALFVPAGLGNSFQSLSEISVYVYMVTDVWRGKTNPYPAVRLDDSDLAIAWPLPREQWIISEKDSRNTSFREAYPL